jgi:hypothetical protein
LPLAKASAADSAGFGAISETGIPWAFGSVHLDAVFAADGLLRKNSDAGFGGIGDPRWIEADLPLSIRFNERLGDFALIEKPYIDKEKPVFEE